MKLLLVDDHTLFLEGLQNLLSTHGLEVVGMARDGFEAVEKARALKPDLILMDIRMPRCDGLYATRLIKAEQPDCKIVILTTSAEDGDLFEAIKSGACGYLIKTVQPNDFISYLSAVLRDEAVVSPELAGVLLREFKRQAERLEPNGEKEELTPRQREVLEMIVTGMQYKEVGTALHVSENTVKYHMREILQRLHARNRDEVVAYALRHRLIGNAPD